MKYRELYKVLQHRMLHSPGFSYTDRSGWRVNRPTYIELVNPLQVIAVDALLRYRFWINHSGRVLSISYCKINKLGANTGNTWNIRCSTKKDLAVQLKKLFQELETDKVNGKEGA